MSACNKLFGKVMVKRLAMPSMWRMDQEWRHEVVPIDCGYCGSIHNYDCKKNADLNRGLARTSLSEVAYKIDTQSGGLKPNLESI